MRTKFMVVQLHLGYDRGPQKGYNDCMHNDNNLRCNRFFDLHRPGRKRLEGSELKAEAGSE